MLELQLRRIGNMLVLTSSTISKVFTNRLDALCGRFDYPQ